MINYSDDMIFNKTVLKCLTFDPYTHPDYKDKIDPQNKQALAEKYYTCASNCFETYDNIPIVNFHYELSCLCIKKCYDLQIKFFN
jgi:hypothetical protein